jgi:adenylate kinase
VRLIFLGAPGAGKGTLAAQISEAYRIPQVSTGDLFRAAVKKGSELGRQVQGIMQRGELVPDDVTVALVQERLDAEDARGGFILDGFPRTIAQADALQKFQTIDAVINFQVGDELVIRRLSGRRVCRACAAIYHVQNMPPKVEGRCDRCGGELYTRDDDMIDAIKNRLRVYKEQTEPLIRYYRDQGLLHDIDSSRSPEDTLQQIKAVLDRGGSRR